MTSNIPSFAVSLLLLSSCGKFTISANSASSQAKTEHVAGTSDSQVKEPPVTPSPEPQSGTPKPETTDPIVKGHPELVELPSEHTPPTPNGTTENPCYGVVSSTEPMWRTLSNGTESITAHHAVIAEAEASVCQAKGFKMVNSCLGSSCSQSVEKYLFDEVKKRIESKKAELAKKNEILQTTVLSHQSCESTSDCSFVTWGCPVFSCGYRGEPIALKTFSSKDLKDFSNDRDLYTADANKYICNFAPNSDPGLSVCDVNRGPLACVQHKCVYTKSDAH